MSFSVEFWLSVLGSGVITGAVGWIFGGRQAKKVEIKNSTGDYLSKVQAIYDVPICVNKSLSIVSLWSGLFR